MPRGGCAIELAATASLTACADRLADTLARQVNGCAVVRCAEAGVDRFLDGAESRSEPFLPGDGDGQLEALSADLDLCRAARRDRVPDRAVEGPCRHDH